MSSLNHYTTALADAASEWRIGEVSNVLERRNVGTNM